jgi:hypothetical protein
MADSKLLPVEFSWGPPLQQLMLRWVTFSMGLMRLSQ